MDKNPNRKYSIKYVIWLAFILSSLLLLSGTALAADSEGVSQKVVIYGGWNTWYLNDLNVTPDSTTINAGDQAHVIFDVAAPHEMQIYGEIWLTGVIGSVYTDSVSVHLEYEESPGNWVPYEGRDGNDVVIPVVNERTQDTYFKIDAYPTDISNYVIAHLPNSFRWRTEIVGEQNGEPFSNNVEQGVNWQGS